MELAAHIKYDEEYGIYYITSVNHEIKEQMIVTFTTKYLNSQEKVKMKCQRRYFR